MIYSIPDQIGILACPGGAAFAGRLARDLGAISFAQALRRGVGGQGTTDESKPVGGSANNLANDLANDLADDAAKGG